MRNRVEGTREKHIDDRKSFVSSTFNGTCAMLFVNYFHECTRIRMLQNIMITLHTPCTVNTEHARSAVNKSGKLFKFPFVKPQIKIVFDCSTFMPYFMKIKRTSDEKDIGLMHLQYHLNLYSLERFVEIFTIIELEVGQNIPFA